MQRKMWCWCHLLNCKLDRGCCPMLLRPEQAQAMAASPDASGGKASLAFPLAPTSHSLRGLWSLGAEDRGRWKGCWPICGWAKPLSLPASTYQSQVHISQDTEGQERGLKCCVCCLCLSRCWHPLGTGCFTRLFTGRPVSALGWTSHYVLVPIFYFAAVGKGIQAVFISWRTVDLHTDVFFLTESLQQSYSCQSGPGSQA